MAPPVTSTPLTRAERGARGKASRADAPRSSQGEWSTPAHRRNPVDILTEQAASRIPELVPVRNGRMVVSPFTFFRGSAAVMAADLATTPDSGLRVQACGDAHLSNFGGYAAPDRELVFDINDFDETIPGPWEWDLKRLVASVAIAGRDRGFDDAERRAVVLATASSYRLAMAEFAALSNLQVWYSRMTSGDVRARWGDSAGKGAVRKLDKLIQKAMTKDHHRAASRLAEVVDGRSRLQHDPPVLVPVDHLLDADELAAFDAVVRNAFRSYRRSLPTDRRRLLEQFSYVDVGRKVVGVGSVGTRAWVVMMHGIDTSEPLFLQLKEAGESVLAPYVGRSTFANEGQRVVAGQQLMQASSDIFLGWAKGPVVDGRTHDFYIRQLWDGKVSADVATQSPQLMGVYGQICGWTLARAHARSGDRVAIAAYLGTGERFDLAMADFAEAYADQNELDHARFAHAIQSGSIEAVTGV